MERKMKNSKDMQELLANTLLGFDVEVRFWYRYELGRQ